MAAVIRIFNISDEDEKLIKPVPSGSYAMNSGSCMAGGQNIAVFALAA